MRFSKFFAIGSVLVFGLAAAGCGGDDDSEDTSTDEGTEETDDATDEGDAGADTGGASVHIMAPEEGEEVSSPVTFELHAEGIDIQPVPDDATEAEDGTGHYHILVDQGCHPVDEAIPTDAEDQGIYHFGDGSTEPVLEDLEPGEHEVCVQAADQLHTALDLTAETSITVTE